MERKTVNSAFLEDILSPLIGGADIDDMAHYEQVNTNDEFAMKQIIISVLLPFFCEQTSKYKHAAKLSMMYYLTTRKVDFGRLIYSNLLPFSGIETPVTFYEWIWDIFWPGEEYNLENSEGYAEVSDMNEPTRYSLRR